MGASRCGQQGQTPDSENKPRDLNVEGLRRVQAALDEMDEMAPTDRTDAADGDIIFGRFGINPD